ncbi:OsmC family protein [Sphingobacterium sp. N143]|uniref:OsmC family protein n=1 Tax=Sphingobacterium sp. N143 TaxID=2746727 RepID=UPI0025784858|nr:OsmC family protein [Sphingobacterium sp. N143]MDM1295707.1 OsmC family protein [Sphingobacterium sp. N143]
MTFKHLFRAALTWTNKKEAAHLARNTYSKNHYISIDGKEDLQVSAAKAFKGDPTLYNPEDLLLSSLVSCHMMSYLYVCSLHDIEIITYMDRAEAVLETYANGSGHFLHVRLNPAVTITDPNKITLALSLHAKANQLCFIANSCNFPVTHYPTCSSA